MTVGIVDTGCGPHPDLVVAGGMNTVVGENPGDYLDSGDQHGTHVAGIVAARGTAPNGMAGLAPQVTLRSYRVFPKGGLASNYSIASAIDQAVVDGCDLINMSLGSQGPSDPATSSAIADARAAGVVVICASGNDGLATVSQPAADPRTIAVGCFGRAGLMPEDSVAASQAGKPDTLNFMASFSNHTMRSWRRRSISRGPALAWCLRFPEGISGRSWMDVHGRARPHGRGGPAAVSAAGTAQCPARSATLRCNSDAGLPGCHVPGIWPTI